jgi:radical SAM superfamily enzyme YgiQ (UPF0313 family)
VEEITMLYSKGARKFRFINDVFVDSSKQGKEWLRKFHHLLKPLNLELNLWMQFRATDIDEEILNLAIDIGLNKILIGLDSGSEKTLQDFNKGLTLNDNIKAVEIIKKSSVKDFAIGYIMFNPYSDINEIRQNLEFLKRMPTFRYSNLFSYAFPYEGTMLCSQLKSEGLAIEGEKWFDIIKYRFRSAVVQKLFDEIMDMRRKYGKLIWFETAVDVEERFISGALQYNNEYRSFYTSFSFSISAFRHQLTMSLLRDFSNILQRIESDNNIKSMELIQIPESLLKLAEKIEISMIDLQSKLKINRGFNLRIDALPKLLE